MNSESGEGGAGGSNGGNPAPTSKELESPNEDWKDNPQLDANGNPVSNKPPVEEPSKEAPAAQPDGDKPKDTSNQEQKTYDLSTPVVQQVESLIKEAGLDVQDVAKNVNDNDGKATPELIKALADKHGDAVAAVVAEQLAGFHESRKNLDNKRNQQIYDQVQEAFTGVTEQSGQETWTELAGWAKENIPNEERKEINKLLAQGGIATKYAIQDLVSRFKSSESFTQSADLITGDNTANDFGVKPLSKTEYVSELRKLEAKGHVYGQSQEMAALDKRRNAGIQRGI